MHSIANMRYVNASPKSDTPCPSTPLSTTLGVVDGKLFDGTIDRDFAVLSSFELLKYASDHDAELLIMRVLHYTLGYFGRKFKKDYFEYEERSALHNSISICSAIKEDCKRVVDLDLCLCNVGYISPVFKIRQHKVASSIRKRLMYYLKDQNKGVYFSYEEMNFRSDGAIFSTMDICFEIIYDNIWSLRIRAKAFVLYRIAFAIFRIQRSHDFSYCFHAPKHYLDLIPALCWKRDFFDFVPKALHPNKVFQMDFMKKEYEERNTMLKPLEDKWRKRQSNKYPVLDVTLNFEEQMFSPWGSIKGSIDHKSEPVKHEIDPRFLDLLQVICENGIDLNTTHTSTDLVAAAEKLKEINLNIGTPNLNTGDFVAGMDKLGNIKFNVPGIEKVPEALSSMGGGFFEKLGPLVVPLVSIACLVLVQKGYITREAIYLGAALVGISYKDSIIKLVRKLFSMLDSPVEEQGPFDSIITIIVESILATLALGTLAKGNLFKFFFQAKDFDRVRAGSENIIHFVLSICQSFVNWLFEMIGAKPWLFYEGRSPELNKTLLEVRDFLEELTNEVTLNYDQAIRLRSIIVRLQDFQMIKGVERHDKERIAAALIALSAYKTKLEEGNWQGHGPRPEPFSVVFAGSSQIGKTSAMHAIKLDILLSTLPKDRYLIAKYNPDTEVYSWDSTDEFKDTYNRQWIVVIDDFGACKDVAGVTTEFRDFMNMKNCMPMPLRAAALNLKGNVWFTSRFILKTTNRTVWELNSMYDATAIIRRFDIVLDCECKMEYRKPGTDQFDKERFGEEEGFKHINYYLATYPGVSVPLQRLSGPMDIHQAISLIRQKSIVAVNRSNKVLKDQGRFAQSAIDRRDANPEFDSGYEPQAFDPSLPVFNQVVGNMMEYAQFTPRFPGAGYLNLASVLCLRAHHFMTVFNLIATGPMVGIDTYEWAESMGRGSEKHALRKLMYKCFPLELFDFLERCWKSTEVWNLADSCFRGDEYLYETKGLGYMIDTSVYTTAVGLSIALGNYDTQLIRTYIKDPFTSDRGWDELDMNVEHMPRCKSCAFCTGEMIWPETDEPDLHNAYRAFGYAPDFDNWDGQETMNMMSGSEDFKKNFEKLEAGIVALKQLACPCPNNAYFFAGISETIHRLDVDFNEDALLHLSYGILLRRYFAVLAKRKKSLGNKFRRMIKDLNTGTINRVGPLICKCKKFLAVVVPISIIFCGTYMSHRIHNSLETSAKKVLFSKEVIRSELLEDSGIPPIKMKENSASGMRLKNTTKAIPNSSSGMRLRTIGKTIPNSNEAMLPFVQRGDFNMAQVMRSIYVRNMYIVYFDDVKLGNILMIKDNVALIMDHYYQGWTRAIEKGTITKEKPLVLKKFGDPGGKKYHWFPEDSCFVKYDKWENKDMIIVELPYGLLPSARSIVEKFISIKDMDNKYADGFYGTLYITSSIGMLDSYNSRVIASSCPSYSENKYENGTCWYYGAPSISGDCGSILAVNDSKANGVVIAGLHIVGTSTPGHGLSFPVFREHLIEILELLGKGPCDVKEEFEPQYVQNSMFPNHMVVGKFPSTKCQKKTQIKRSPLYAVLGKVLYYPPRFVDFKDPDGNLIRPIQLAMDKYHPTDANLDVDMIESVSQHTSNFVFQHCIPETLRENKVFSYEVGCEGIEGDPFARALRRTKSAGSPWNLDIPPGFKGKQHIFGKEGKFDYENKYAIKVRERVDYVLEQAKQGSRVVMLATINPKDEVLPQVKVLAGKVRLFFGFPVEMLILDRMYNLAFRRCLMINRIRNTSCIGINVYSHDWDKLVRYLSFEDSNLTGCKMFIAGDHSAFDGKMPFVFSTQYTKHKNDFYMDLNTGIREILDSNIVDAYVLFDGMVYKFNSGNPSGCPDTASRNTKVHLDYIAYSALLIRFPNDYSPRPKVSVEKSLKYLTYFFSVTRHAIFGDDHASSVHPYCEIYGIHDQKALTLAYKCMGLKYTNDVKDSLEEYSYRSILDITFLKRNFVYDNKRKRWIAPLLLDSIKKSLDWMSDSKTADADFLNTINTAICEYSLHSEEVYYRNANQVVKASREILGFSPKYYKWQDMRDICLAIDEIF